LQLSNFSEAIFKNHGLVCTCTKPKQLRPDIKAENIFARRKENGKVNFMTKVLWELMDCKNWVEGECAKMRANCLVAEG
jgi:hypothetical protein